MKKYIIDGQEFETIPNYLAKDNFMRPVTPENFTIQEIEYEVAEPAALTAIKGVLASEIDKLNIKYPALELTADDTILSAIPKLLAVEALKDEVVYLKMLYDTVKEAGGK
jgi:hypothetical protein